MGDKMKLEDLAKEGWEVIDKFADCDIYAKGKERIFYNHTTEEIILKGYYKEVYAVEKAKTGKKK